MLHLQTCFGTKSTVLCLAGVCITFFTICGLSPKRKFDFEINNCKMLVCQKQMDLINHCYLYKHTRENLAFVNKLNNIYYTPYLRN